MLVDVVTLPKRCVGVSIRRRFCALPEGGSELSRCQL
jgi:hypothetical protein